MDAPTMETPLQAPRQRPLLYNDELEDRDIVFRHPGYAGPTNVLFTLARSDIEDRNGTVFFGLHHGTALLACQIIANNAFDTGFFATDAAGFERVNVPLDGILTGGEYYFFISGIGQYPVVPSFRDWTFPHDDIDNIWPTIPGEGPDDTIHCLLSGNRYAINSAHIVPREEVTWYEKNGLGSFADIDDATNIIPLRKDLHKCFDDRWFVIVPKPAPNGIHYATHILLPSATEIWPAHHNIQVLGLSNRRTKRLLFARFAWAVIQGVKQFVVAGPRRKVVQVDETEAGGIISKESYLEGSKLKESYAGGGSKNATPLKRRQPRAPEHDDLEELSSDDSDLEASSFWDIGGGRSGKRQGYSPDDTALDIVPSLPKRVQEELEAAAADVVNSQDLVEEDA